MIGIFDTGMCGLLLAATLKDSHPHQQILYFGDTLHSSCDSIPDEIIISRCRAGCNFLIEQGAKIILIACHTTSAIAASILKQELSVPLIDMITPVAEAAVRKSQKGCIGVIGTRKTIDSGVYHTAIKIISGSARVHSSALPLLVPLVEEGWHNRNETKMIIKRYLRPLRDKQIDTLIPACSHFQTLTSLIAPRLGRNGNLLDPNQILTEHSSKILQSIPLSASDEALSIPLYRCYITNLNVHNTRFAEKLLNQKITFTEI